MYIYDDQTKKYIACFDDDVVFNNVPETDKQVILQMYSDTNLINTRFNLPASAYPAAKEPRLKREIGNVASRYTGEYYLSVLPGKVVQPGGGSSRTEEEFIALISA